MFVHPQSWYGWEAFLRGTLLWCYIIPNECWLDECPQQHLYNALRVTHLSPKSLVSSCSYSLSRKAQKVLTDAVGNSLSHLFPFNLKGKASTFLRFGFRINTRYLHAVKSTQSQQWACAAVHCGSSSSGEQESVEKTIDLSGASISLI